MFDIPLLIKLFIPSIEIKHIHYKHQIKEHRCKFNIDKITYSKRSLEQRMTLAKLNLYCILNAEFAATNASLVKIPNKKLDEIISKCYYCQYFIEINWWPYSKSVKIDIYFLTTPQGCTLSILRVREH